MIGLMSGHKRRGETYEVAKNVLYSTRAARKYMLPNIISYDFVNEATNRQIVDLKKKFMQQVGDGDGDDD